MNSKLAVLVLYTMYPYEYLLVPGYRYVSSTRYNQADITAFITPEIPSDRNCMHEDGDVAAGWRFG